MLLNAPGFFVFGALTCAAGVVAFAFYALKGCDPLRGGSLSNPNQILPYFVMEIIGYPGLPGLFVACLYSASLSTLSSSLNAMAAVTLEDIVKPCLKNAKPAKLTNISKLMVAIYGATGLATGFAVQLIGGTFVQIAFSIIGSGLGPLIGMIFLGATWPRASYKGAFCGAWIGLAFSCWISMGSYTSGIHVAPLATPTYNCTFPQVNMTLLPPQMITAPPVLNNVTEIVHGIKHIPQTRTILQTLYAISYLYYPFIGISIVLLIGFLTSFIPGWSQEGYVPDRHLFPFVRFIRRKLTTRTPEQEALESRFAAIDEKIILGETVDERVIEAEPLNEKEYIIAMETNLS